MKRVTAQFNRKIAREDCQAVVGPNFTHRITRSKRTNQRTSALDRFRRSTSPRRTMVRNTQRAVETRPPESVCGHPRAADADPF